MDVTGVGIVCCASCAVTLAALATREAGDLLISLAMEPALTREIFAIAGPWSN